jgi:SRSO17 transposase
MKIYAETKISEYLKGFGQLFVCHRTDNIRKCGQFVSGLLHECKSNLERMVERVPESDYDQLQHFISDSPWDAMAVMDAVAEKVSVSLSAKAVAQGSTTSIGLLLDESGWEKAGQKSVGVARQYIGQVGKVANGQTGVFASLCNGEQVGLLQGRLYLPQAWVDDQVRCRQAGIPAADQIYRTKPELAVEIIKTLPATVLYDWVGGDSIYGNSLVVREHLHAKKQAFVLDVGEELGVYLVQPQPYIPVKKAGRGRTPSAYVCDAKPLSLKDLQQQIPDDHWQTITHRQGTKGALTRKAAILDVYLWKPEGKTAIEAVQLLISMETDGSEIKSSLCYTPAGKMALETALFRQMQRYWIERAFQNSKEQLGLHQYQVRSWRAWHHHIALTLMALHFILQVQQDNQDEMPLLSVPDIKLIFAKKLLNKLNSDDGLLLALHLRHRQRIADLVRHSKVPK